MQMSSLAFRKAHSEWEGGLTLEVDDQRAMGIAAEIKPRDHLAVRPADHPPIAHAVRIGLDRGRGQGPGVARRTMERIPADRREHIPMFLTLVVDPRGDLWTVTAVDEEKRALHRSPAAAHLLPLA